MAGVRCSICDGACHVSSRLFSVSTSDLGYRASDVTLAWRPFLDPAPIDRYWLWLLVPLILLIALVYRTIKSERLGRLPRAAGYLAFQISVFMVLAAAALWLLLLFV